MVAIVLLFSTSVGLSMTNFSIGELSSSAMTHSKDGLHTTNFNGSLDFAIKTLIPQDHGEIKFIVIYIA